MSSRLRSILRGFPVSPSYDVHAAWPGPIIEVVVDTPAGTVPHREDLVDGALTAD